ncbi:MAG: stage II sporulation protein M [Clostridiales bacterium]|jgi:stage II sporulation protein M|nr:stage II sporulation protein M [Clostridiales bacterium]
MEGKKKLNQVLSEYMNRNKAAYILMISALIAGICAGSFLTGRLGEDLNAELSKYVQSYVATLSQGILNSSEIFWAGIIQNVKYVLLIYLFGLTVVGLPFIMALEGLKGFAIGFTAAAAFKFLSGNGVAATFISMLPGDVIIVPAMIVMGVNSMNFSLNLIKNYKNKLDHESIWSLIAHYTLNTFFLFVVIAMGVAYEAYIAPVFI